MPYFKIRQRTEYDNQWVPDHPEIEWLAAHADDETPFEQKRVALHGYAEAMYPGVYTLEWNLNELKAERIAAVNARTAAIIAGGFIYSGIRYSTSEQAQLLYLNCRTLIPPAITINHWDDNGDTAFTNLTIGGFVNAALGFVRSTLDSGTLIKRQIRLATTVEAVQAVVDAR